MTLNINNLEALSKAATEGPWTICVIFDDHEHLEIIQSKMDENDVHIGEDIVLADNWDPEAKEDRYSGVVKRADADYIVAACNAVPQLIARIRELENQLG